MLIVDGHLDLAMLALDWNRDLTLPVAEIRRSEEAEGTEQFLVGGWRGRTVATVALPEMRAGGVGLCLGTVLARTRRAGNPLPGYASPAGAAAWAQAHLAYYLELERRGEVRRIDDAAGLDLHLTEWSNPALRTPVGVILAMEGADPLVAPEDIHWWRERGLRSLSLSHYGANRFAFFTPTEGGVTDLGRALIREMRGTELVLDLTHTADAAFWEALELWDGPVHCSHQNCRALVADQRQMSDEQLRAVIERGGVIGVALDAWMLVPGWNRRTSHSSECRMERVADHIDHVCRLAGSARHAAIGSDLDGGFGREGSPAELETIADLRKLGPLLRARGYSESDVSAIFHGNLTALFRRAWSASAAG